MRLRTTSLRCDCLHARAAEAGDGPATAAKYNPSQPFPKDVVPCYDPCTMQLLGHVPAMSAREVRGGGRRALS